MYCMLGNITVGATNTILYTFVLNILPFLPGADDFTHWTINFQFFLFRITFSLTGSGRKVFNIKNLSHYNKIVIL
jgi:hypothetical protein